LQDVSKEVAERICEKKGSKAYGILSVGASMMLSIYLPDENVLFRHQSKIRCNENAQKNRL
jgi:hypothetical protein